MAIQQVASPLGVVLGYALTFGLKTGIAVDGVCNLLIMLIYLINELILQWGYSYIIQCILLLGLAIGTSFIDESYFLTNVRLANDVKVIEGSEAPKEEELKEGDEETKKKEETPEDIKKREEEEELKRQEELTPEGSYDEDDISIYYDYTDEDTNEIPSFFKHMKSIFQQRVNNIT